MQTLKEFAQKQWNRIKRRTSLGLGSFGILLVAIPLICLVIVLVEVIDARDQERQLQQNFSEAEARLKMSQLILRYLIDQETGVRGYLLTQDPQFLDPYYLAKRDLPMALETLKRQSPDQEIILNDLKQKIDVPSKMMDELLDIAKRMNLVLTPSTSSNIKPSLSKSDSENLLEKLQQSKVVMDSIRQTIVQFDDRQREIFNQQQTKIVARRQWIDRIQIIGIVVSIVIYLGIIVLFRLLDRQLVQRNRERLYLRIALEEKAKELAYVNTALVSTNIALNRKNKSLENFIQAAAHDLKTPLRGIASLAQWIQEEWIQEGLEKRDDHEGYFNLLNQRILRIQIIINELLKYTKIEAWMNQLQLVNVDLLIQEIRSELPITDNFELQILTPMPKLTTSYFGLKLVFEELIQNSIQHHDRNKGIITLESTSYADRIEFVIQDDGPGIPLSYRAQVLGMFQVLDRLGSENVGAGLALVNQAIELNGGQLWLENVDSECHSKRGLKVRFTWLLVDKLFINQPTL